MIRIPNHRLNAGLAALSLAFSATADDLSDVLGLVPADAVAWAVAPSLSRFNADLGDLIDRAERPELAVAGRPVDVLVSQFGVAAGFDERGSLAIWSPSVADLLEGAGVVAVPVESAERFLSANLVPVPDEGPTAGRLADGTVLHHRALDGHVLLAATPEMLGEGPSVAVATLGETFGEDALAVMRRSDLVLRIDGGAVADLQAAARTQAEAQMESDSGDWDLPMSSSLGGLDPLEAAARLETLAGGAMDIAVAIDADALALGVRGWTRYAASSEIAALAAGARPVSRPVLSSLPDGPYYLAFGLDLAAFGGSDGWRRLAAMLGDEFLDPAALDVLSSVSGLAFSTRPSKLGVAMGGVLNDASLTLLTEDPDVVRTAIASSIASIDGVRGAIDRSATFERDVEQRRGGVADQITVTADVADAADREEGSRVGDASLQLTAERFIFGPRGWNGLGRVVDDGYVVTFSRRPDVMAATVAAMEGLEGAGPEGRGLAADPTLVAMRSWLPEAPGLELFIDVGRLVGLARQVASLVPGADGAIPEVPENMPPIGAGLALEPSGADARIAWGLVVPSEVIGAVIGAGMREMMADGPGAP